MLAHERQGRRMHGGTNYFRRRGRTDVPVVKGRVTISAVG